MSDRYVLQGHTPVQCDCLSTWAVWMESGDRRVALTKKDGVRVSTMFLGLDHSFGDGEPLLFETMAFGGKLDQEMDRYSTWEEAEEGHLEMCKKVWEVGE